MKTININGKEFTELEFHKVGVGFFHECAWCDEAEELPDEIFKAIDLNFPRHEPEPPTVRPMSELPEGNVNITVLYDSADFGRFWEDGSSHNGLVYLDKGGRFKKRENYSNCYKEKLLGWIPKQELPNPNDIKL